MCLLPAYKEPITSTFQMETNTTRDLLKLRIKQYEENSMDIGKSLYDIKEEKKYKEWGYKTLEDYVKTELGMDLRRAYYHMSIWSAFGVILKLSESDINRIGWTKAGHMAALVKNGTITNDNIAEWIKTASEMNTKNLIEYVKKYKGGKSDDSIVPVENYHQAMSPTVDGTLHKITFWLYPEQHENIQRALSVAGKAANSTKFNHLIDIICMQYLTSNMANSADERHQLNWFLQQIEATFKVKLIAFRNPNDLRAILERTLKDLNVTK